MPAPDLLHDNLAKAAVNHPGRVAFKYLDQALTYRELDRGSDRLAGVLALLGFSAGDRAGVFMNRCLETAVAGCDLHGRFSFARMVSSICRKMRSKFSKPRGTRVRLTPVP